LVVQRQRFDDESMQHVERVAARVHVFRALFEVFAGEFEGEMEHLLLGREVLLHRACGKP
jgi:hypothetical protein